MRSKFSVEFCASEEVDDKDERRCSVCREDSGERRGTFLSGRTAAAALATPLLSLLEVVVIVGTGNVKWDISSSNKLYICVYVHNIMS